MSRSRKKVDVVKQKTTASKGGNQKKAEPTGAVMEGLAKSEEATKNVVEKEGSKPDFKSRNRRRRRESSEAIDTKPVTPPTTMTVPPGYGVLLPKFLATTTSDEDTFIGLGYCFGRYQPMCDAGVGSYADYADHYAQMILAQLRDLGYAPTYEVKDIRNYFNGLAELHHLHRYVYHLRTLADHTKIHSARSITAVCAAGISGRLVATQRSLGGQLGALPFPETFVKALHTGLDITTMSDNPNSPIRMFVPIGLKQLDADPANRVLTASKAVDYINSRMDVFFSDATNRELAAILPLPGHDLEEKATGHITFNNHVVNNLLNQPYYDVSYAPSGGETTNVSVYARRQMDEADLYTFAPGDAANHTVWRTAFQLENHNPLWYPNDSAELTNAYLDHNAFANFGTVWENDLGAVPGTAPSITKVSASFEGVAKGIAAQMFGV
jgi:hypothetical protein